MAEYVNILSPVRDWGDMSDTGRAAERESICRGALIEVPDGITIIGVQLEKNAKTVPVLMLDPNVTVQLERGRRITDIRELLGRYRGPIGRGRMRVADAAYVLATADILPQEG